MKKTTVGLIATFFLSLAAHAALKAGDDAPLFEARASLDGKAFATAEARTAYLERLDVLGERAALAYERDRLAKARESLAGLQAERARARADRAAQALDLADRRLTAEARRRAQAERALRQAEREEDRALRQARQRALREGTGPVLPDVSPNEVARRRMELRRLGGY